MSNIGLKKLKNGSMHFGSNFFRKRSSDISSVKALALFATGCLNVTLFQIIIHNNNNFHTASFVGETNIERQDIIRDSLPSQV